jgi:hypothetical protein
VPPEQGGTADAIAPEEMRIVHHEYLLDLERIAGAVAY